MRVSLCAMVSSPTCPGVSRHAVITWPMCACTSGGSMREMTNPLIGEHAGDAHRAREPKRDAREILIRDRDDVLLIVDDDELRETFQTMKRALALGHAAATRPSPACDAPHLLSLSTPDQVCGA